MGRKGFRLCKMDLPDFIIEISKIQLPHRVTYNLLSSPFIETVFNLCSLSLCCHLGDDVRRYLSGPPGPQGPPGPPGASVGISASYSVEEIATHIYNIMNGRFRLHITVTLSLNVDQISQTSIIVIFQREALQEVHPAHPVLLVLPVLPVQGSQASVLQRLTTLHSSEVKLRAQTDPVSV